MRLEKHLTPEQVAESLGLTARTVKEWCKCGHFGAGVLFLNFPEPQGGRRRTGAVVRDGCWRIPARAVADFIERSRIDTGKPA